MRDRETDRQTDGLTGNMIQGRTKKNEHYIKAESAYSQDLERAF